LDTSKRTLPAVIGLCGRSGAGKGLVSELFSELGIPSVDTDAIYREMTAPTKDFKSLSPCMKELVSAFSEEILNGDLSLDRRCLAEMVFSESGGKKLALLNSITHKHILARTDEIVEKYGRQGVLAVVVDAPVLFESGYDKKCDLTVAVTAPDELLLERIVSRDGVTLEMARRRLASQKTNGELAALADTVIENISTAEALRDKVRAVAALAADRAEKRERTVGNEA